jgi:hypothetical protein
MTIKTVISRILGVPVPTNDDANVPPIDLSATADHAERNLIFQRIGQLKSSISTFLGPQSEVNEYISLGQNCTVAWYLKQTALKKASYPFDWIFTSPEIVSDTIENGFVDFLDQKMLIQLPGKPYMGHQKYHSRIFNHKNPIKDIGYYERCSDRFLQVLKADCKNVFIMILLNETEKRLDWKNGFDRLYSLPVNQSPMTVMPMINGMLSINPSAKFILLDVYTENNRRDISPAKISDEVFSIKVLVKSHSTGVYFTDALDDFLFKLIFLAFRE